MCSQHSELSHFSGMARRHHVQPQLITGMAECFQQKAFSHENKNPAPGWATTGCRVDQVNRQDLLDMAGAAQCAAATIGIATTDARENSAGRRAAFHLVHIVAGCTLHLAVNQQRLIDALACQGRSSPTGWHRPRWSRYWCRLDGEPCLRITDLVGRQFQAAIGRCQSRVIRE